ncbi:hypothetical protein SEA_APHELION_160 [Gordonia phage Aphelion]|uniref:Uncharacterized protein n=1 Tax=Gordonia phage Aphelion TaxID=2507860 RepID=A0A410TDD0_9CAUD|nr:hypothetical protein SEA_APHELION_160 [Gordonia phage Aphelion]
MAYQLTTVAAEHLEEGDELRSGILVTDFNDFGHPDYVWVGFNDGELSRVRRQGKFEVYR